MTTLEQDVAVEVEATEEVAPEAKKGRKRDLDFTQAKDHHQELADYVNAHSGIDPLTANQVKALLTLKQDWADTDEQKAKREAARIAREAAAEKYAGLTPEQTKAEKAAERAEKQADKLRQRVEESLAKAKALREGTTATGEDIAAAVKADQNGTAPTFSDSEDEKPSGRFGRRK